MLLSAVNYIINDEMHKAFEHLGFPEYFRVELAIAKLIGVLILVIPSIKSNIKEWAYAGFGITLISASISHASVGDGIGQILSPIIMFVILVLSYFYKPKINNEAEDAPRS